MKKHPSILVAFVIAALLVVGWRFYGGHTVPLGQAPLVSLPPNEIEQLRAAFNNASGDVRIVLLLSPT